MCGSASSSHSDNNTRSYSKSQEIYALIVGNIDTYSWCSGPDDLMWWLWARSYKSQKWFCLPAIIEYRNINWIAGLFSLGFPRREVVTFPIRFLYLTLEASRGKLAQKSPMTVPYYDSYWFEWSNRDHSPMRFAAALYNSNFSRTWIVDQCVTATTFEARRARRNPRLLLNPTEIS